MHEVYDMVHTNKYLDQKSGFLSLDLRTASAHSPATRAGGITINPTKSYICFR